MNKLDQTLSHWKRSKFVWGESDCLLSVADYIVACGGKDGGAPYRGKYDSEAAALEHVRQAGGAAKMIDATGLVQIKNPIAGDPVLIKTAEGEVAGLHTGSNIAVRREHGVALLSVRLVNIINAWDIQSCRL